IQVESLSWPKLGPDPRQIRLLAADPRPGVCSDVGRNPLQTPCDAVDLRCESLVAALRILVVPDAGGRNVGGGMRAD
ncbi:hypothetical protein LZ30DRAFT_600714, partial [Colletotrichum cereale]